MLLAYPEGRLHSSFERFVVGAGYFVATIGQLPSLLFMQLNEVDGCEGCPRNLLLVHHNQDLGQLLLGIDQILAVFVLGAVVAIIWRRLRAATPPQRRTLAPVLWSGAIMVVALGFQLGSQVAGSSTASDIIGALGALAFASIPYAFLGVLVRSRMSRAAAVEDLVARLTRAPGPGRLRDALAEALGDDTVSVAYWLPESERYVDGSRPARRAPRAGRGARGHDRRARRRVRGGDRPRRRRHRRGPRGRRRRGAGARERAPGGRAARAPGGPARLAQPRRGGRAWSSAGAWSATSTTAPSSGSSRSRSSSSSRAPGCPRTPTPPPRLLDAANDELRQALEELRELARGIHPAILTDRGLDAALEALVARAPVPVEVCAIPDERLPSAVEAAAYFVIAESLTNVAKYAHAGHATIRVERRNGAAVVEVSDDGVGGADPARGTGLSGLADRLAAMDGRLRVESPSGQGTVVTAEIPCG